MSVERLIVTLRERASYLRSMIPEGLSEIERQSMQAMEDAAAELVRLDTAIATAFVNLERPTCAPHVPDLLRHVMAGGSVNTFKRTALSRLPCDSGSEVKG